MDPDSSPFSSYSKTALLNRYQRRVEYPSWYHLCNLWEESVALLGRRGCVANTRAMQVRMLTQCGRRRRTRRRGQFRLVRVFARIHWVRYGRLCGLCSLEGWSGGVRSRELLGKEIRPIDAKSADYLATMIDHMSCVSIHVKYFSPDTVSQVFAGWSSNCQQPQPN